MNLAYSACLVLAMLLALPQLAMADEGILAVVRAKTVPLREAPSSKSLILGRAPLGLLLHVIGTSADRQWRKVTLEEEGAEGIEGDGFRERVFWVPAASIHMEAPARAEIFVDVSSLEKPDGIFGRRVDAKDFIFGAPDLTPPFYLSTTYTQPNDVSCSPPLLVCSSIEIPGESWEDPNDDPKLRKKAEVAFARGFIRPILQIRSRVKIKRVDEIF